MIEEKVGGRKTYKEPGGRDTDDRAPVSFEDEPVRSLGTHHRLLLESSSFVHSGSPEQDEEGRKDSEAEDGSPDAVESVVSSESSE